MKRRFTKILAALALLVGLTIPLGMWGETVTFTAGTDTGTASVTKGGITITMSTMNESVYKCYKSSSMTVSSTVGNITQVTLTCTAEGQEKYGPGCFSLTNTQPGEYSYNGNTGTWTGDAESFSLFASLNQVRMSKIVVTVGAVTYTVTYNANNATSGTVPTDNTQYEANATVTVMANTGNLAKDHYTFGGWNTAADGGGTAYTAGQTFNITANTTLYAQWIVDTYGYTLNITGEESHAETALYVDGVELQANDEIAYEAEVTISVITDDFYAYSISVKDASNNTVTFNTTTESFIMPASAVTITVNITEIPTWTVSFTTNGIADGTKQVIQGDAIGTLPEATAEYIPAGYTFVGWYNGDITEPIQTAPTFISPADPVNSSLTLKAVFAIGNSSGSSDTYALVSDVNDLDDGDIIILVSTGSYKVSGVTYYFTVANATVNSSNLMDPVDVTISDNKVTSTDVAPITLVEVTGGWKLQMGTQYLNIVAGKNQITLDDNGATHTIAISSNNIATVGAVDGTSTRNLQYNPNNGSNDRFAYYTSSQKPIAIYKQELSVVYSNYRTSLTESYTLPITGYNVGGGWNLIASPVAVDPATVEGMVVANTDENYEYFDLYYFDQTGGQNGKEWKNYKAKHFNLVPGKGYLYANKTGGNYTLAGTSYSGNGVVDLDYFTTNPSEGMRGLNLIGNPYNANTTIESDREFYIMNGAGTQIVPADNEHKTIAPMQGIIVKANRAGERVTFTPANEGSNSNNNSSVVMNLSQNRGGVIDRAIVRFGNGGTLPKIQLFENSTKLYISQYNEDYAVVKAEAQGEMPVNFKAAENGTYTLTVNLEGVDMNYLHLIDNMTGMDIDLLQTPSYTFEANTNDYANRFKLVFAANGTDEADESSFAFFSNGNLIVNNEGNATLQVIDINGRILSSETISGSCSKAINATTGVYMLRLINGENVKVQKVVVR